MKNRPPCGRLDVSCSACPLIDDRSAGAVAGCAHARACTADGCVARPRGTVVMVVMMLSHGNDFLVVVVLPLGLGGEAHGEGLEEVVEEARRVVSGVIRCCLVRL